MGVQGLWSLLKDIPSEYYPEDQLKGKIICIDTSLWLYQFLRLPSAPATDSSKISHLSSNSLSPHERVLMGFFQRICKLTHLGIRPIFVFDQAVPRLKLETIAKRKLLNYDQARQTHRKKQKLISSKLLALIQNREDNNAPHFKSSRQALRDTGSSSPELSSFASSSEDVMFVENQLQVSRIGNRIASQPNRIFQYVKLNSNKPTSFSDEEFSEIILPVSKFSVPQEIQENELDLLKKFEPIIDRKLILV